MKNRLVFLAIAVAAILLCVFGWRMHRVAFLAGYFAVWWFWFGTAMGGLANVWLHNLTGGAWGEAIREPLLRFSRTTWVAALLFLPVLLGMHDLYPWAADADAGAARWAGELSAPAFKSAWLMPGFFAARSIAYLIVLSVLALLSQRPSLRRSKPLSAAAMIIYGFVISLASVDWIMSLMPLWYSSVFGWLVAMGQMLAGMALAIVLVAARSRKIAPQPAPAIFRDLGNLLLMYVMSWAYLAFSQFLIIWAENLPHEIAWYLPRMRMPWLPVAWLLALFFFAAPLLILLSRNAKQSPRLMGWLAAALLLMQFVDCCWLILPSLSVPALNWLWALPLNLAVLGGIMLACWQRPAALPQASEERVHA